jgi:hypothetical protein
MNAIAVAAAASSSTNDPYEPLWFIYYMFFAIHNPKMEDYIQKKTSPTATATATATTAAAHVIKNMIKRRQHTSTIVFQLYTHAYTNEGTVSVVYPKDKYNIANQLIKSFQSNRLKTTAVLLRRCAAASTSIHDFIEYIMTTQITLSTVTSANSVLDKINNHIRYQEKGIILLALTCYMKIDEDDINKKGIFISATPGEETTIATTAAATTAATTATATAATEIETPYDYKYKYLYS